MRTRWEYMTVEIEWWDQVQPRLDALGDDGWEVVAVIPATGVCRVLLKRPVGE